MYFDFVDKIKRDMDSAVTADKLLVGIKKDIRALYRQELQP